MIYKTIRLLLTLICFSPTFGYAENNQLIKIAYVTQEIKVPAALSNLDPFVQQKGLAGAELAITDNNTTGQFTGQQFELIKIVATVDEDVVEKFIKQVDQDISFVITNLPEKQLVKLTGLSVDKEMLFFDATTTDDKLRNQQCHNNTFHLLPSRAMRADALAQYLLKKKWNKWFLVTGMTQADKDYAAAIKRAAKRFGMKIVAEKSWTHTYDARRTAQSDVPVFTQTDDYDVLVVADEQGLFGEYFEYRSWIPRPVVGTQGLVPTSWHRTHEQWGAVQIQNRFKKWSGRHMEEQDYGAYLAVRAIGEATVRTKSEQVEKIKDYLLSKDFALQGYKGIPLSFRSWNGQLRQPVLLAAARSLVTAAPIEGFLHPKTELDTLGYDQAESYCNNPEKINSHLPLTKDIENDKPAKSQLEYIKQRMINLYNQYIGNK